jgi:hypothetical protein
MPRNDDGIARLAAGLEVTGVAVVSSSAGSPRFTGRGLRHRCCRNAVVRREAARAKIKPGCAGAPKMHADIASPVPAATKAS